MANASKTSNPKGVPYAKADPYTGPTAAAKRKNAEPNSKASEIRATVQRGTVNRATGETTWEGAPQEAPLKSISIDEFNKMAKGGTVRAKNWERALADHERQRASRSTPAKKPMQRGNW